MMRLFKSKFFLLLEIIILMFAVSAFIKISTKKKSIQTEINDLANKVEEAGQESIVLSEWLKRASSDFYQELQAKRGLNYKRPGETVFVFYEDSIEGTDGNSATVFKEEINDHASNPVLWWRFFLE